MSDLPATEDLDLGLAESEEILKAPEDAELEGAEDEGIGDAEDGEDAEGAEAEGDVEPEPRRGGGGAGTPRTLRRRAQEAERLLAQEQQERIADRARLAALEGRIANDPGAQQRAAEQERELRSRMTAEELIEYVENKSRRDIGSALQQIRNENANNVDRLAFQAAARTSPLYAKYQSEVERVHQQELAAGRFHPREGILDNIVGREMRLRAGRAGPVQRRQAAARVEGQRARPTGARGDAAPVRRAPAGSYEADLALIKDRPLW